METNSAWQKRYANKLARADDAVRRIAPGRRMLIASGAAEPATLVSALVRNADHFADNEIVHLLTLGPAPYVREGMQKHFRHTAFFIGANVRQSVQSGRADFMPVFLSEVPRLIRTGRVRVDAALLSVSPPDAHGYVSLGVSVDIVRAAVEAATLIIAEVNPNMPRTLGDSFVPVDRIDWLVPVETSLFELEAEPIDPVSAEIGRHVASLIPDGATLQTGIGKIPHAVLSALSDRQDLGVHTEMLSDSIIDLVESGVITGRKKTLLPGKLVTSFIMGSQRLYDWVNDNPAIEMRSSDFTNDPFVVARNDQMMAINSALAVDLTGQVAADTLGGRFFSGIGGQVDFIRGAARSTGGKPIIAFPSTAKHGTLSRIQAALEQGAGVVTSRGDVHYVVTEYGVAHLWGRSIRERTNALIDIAHPDFRADLVSSAKARHYVFPDQPVPHHVPEEARETTLSLADGTRLSVRPLRMADQDAIQDLLYRLSDQASIRQALQINDRYSHEELLRLVDLDQAQNAALVVTVDDEAGALIAMARYDVDPATGGAKVALVVEDAWQDKGIGTALFARLADLARARGINALTAGISRSNRRMHGIFLNSGFPMESLLKDGVDHMRLSLEEGPVPSRKPSLKAHPN